MKKIKLLTDNGGEMFIDPRIVKGVIPATKEGYSMLVVLNCDQFIPPVRGYPAEVNELLEGEE